MLKQKRGMYSTVPIHTSSDLSKFWVLVKICRASRQFDYVFSVEISEDSLVNKHISVVVHLTCCSQEEARRDVLSLNQKNHHWTFSGSVPVYFGLQLPFGLSAS